ncbi:MAG TPA: DUF2000 domain-containing protein [Synergistales bacterium]|nr:DUF2000 domain-containing protein [Synergistales bacterium]
MEGEPHEDASGNRYLPLIQQPVLIFPADRDQMKTVYERASKRGLQFNIYTEDLFTTYNDPDNRAAVKVVRAEDLNLVGMALFGPKNGIDRTMKGLELHP